MSRTRSSRGEAAASPHDKPSRNLKPSLESVLLVLCCLLAAALIIIYRLSFFNLGINQTLQTLTEENEALRKNLSERKCHQCLHKSSSWERHGGKCYYFNVLNLSWKESRDECRWRGGDLVKIDSREKQAFLARRVEEMMKHLEDRFWIGLTDSEEEGRWLWVDGSPLNQRLSYWTGNEPDNWRVENPAGENCVRMGMQGSPDPSCWMDKSCEAPHRSICEKSAGGSPVYLGPFLSLSVKNTDYITRRHTVGASTARSLEKEENWTSSQGGWMDHVPSDLTHRNMADVDLTYADVTFTRPAARDDVSSPDNTTYSEVKFSKNLTDSQQTESKKRSKVTSERVALLVLSVLLAAAVVAFVVTYIKPRTTPCSTPPPTGSPPLEIKNQTCLKCGAGWELHGGRCYYFNNLKSSWNEVRGSCRDLGGDLVKIDSREEQEFLKTRIINKTTAWDMFWIGLTDSVEEGRWFWVDGSPLNTSLSFWHKGEPNNFGKNPAGEDCVRMGIPGTSTDLNWWADNDCKDPNKSICEKSPEVHHSSCV